MQGLELSERYFREVGKPVFERAVPELMPHLAFGLCGDGSDCLGFDDAYSRDHDFGPGFQIFVSDRDFEEYGKRLSMCYRSLPEEFLGFRRNTTNQGSDRVGVIPISVFYRRYTGCPKGPETMLQWFYVPEHFLAKATSGAVFADPAGEFTGIREKLLDFYPEQVRWKKLAARAMTMAQAGQYNYPRAIKRQDVGAAFFALREFVTAACSLYHLMNRRYMPYYKWSMASLKTIPGLQNTAAELEAMMETPMAVDNIAVIERICIRVREEWNREGLAETKEDFLEAAAWELYRKITDQELSKRHISDG